MSPVVIKRSKRVDASKHTRNQLYGWRWQKYRKHYIAHHPLCAICEAEGRIEPATVVDHIKPHNLDAALFWDPDNHRALSKRCHDLYGATDKRRSCND
jgi:5-methylcytosine-specific restriction enzyme A